MSEQWSYSERRADRAVESRFMEIGQYVRGARGCFLGNLLLRVSRSTPGQSISYYGIRPAKVAQQTWWRTVVVLKRDRQDAGLSIINTPCLQVAVPCPLEAAITESQFGDVHLNKTRLYAINPGAIQSGVYGRNFSRGITLLAGG